MKILKRVLLVFCVLFASICTATYIFMRQSLAPLDGELKLEGLSQKVTVTRDTYGIPHIKAANKKEALRALGYVMASERLFQMELSRRLTQGKLSEIFGELALPTDKLYRSLMLKKSAERILAHQKQSQTFDHIAWEEMSAFFEGVNFYIRTRPLPYEFALLRFKPEPFSPIDGIVMTGHMAYSFGIAIKADPLFTGLAKALPEASFQELRNDRIKSPLKVVSEKIFKSFLQSYNLAPQFDGSNAWLLSPARSTSGKSLFANDPHIGFSNPSVWFEAHIQTPEFELYGHYLPLVPYAVLGHSRHHAWGFTMSLTDDMDLYREKINREEKTVLFRGKPHPYQEWTEIIKVKKSSDVVLNMIETPHGPLMDHAMEEKNLALKWAFHRLENNTTKALRLMGEASTMADFEKALQLATAPGLNVMYADASNIAWWTLGDIAIKRNPNSDMILDGASGLDEYTSYLPWKDKPHSVNPASGVIVTANSRPPGLSENIRGDWQADDRLQTITKILSEKKQWAAEEFQKVQTENFSIFTGKILNQLMKNLKLNAEDQTRYESWLHALTQWDQRSEVHSHEASLFHLWNNANIRLILQDLEETQRKTYLSTPFSWNFYRRVIFDEKSPWWEKRPLSDVVTQGFLEVMETYPQIPEWGRIHTIEFIHPLGRIAPLNRIFNIGPMPIAGAYNEINNNKQGSFGGSDFKVTAGASTRRIIDFAHPEKSWGINPIGVSGHILSVFSRDQVELFVKGQYRAQIMDEKDIEAAKTHTLILQ